MPTRNTSAEMTSTADDEMRRWKSGLAFESGWSSASPDPETENGLPAGWVLRFRRNDYRPECDAVLARRETGGWVLFTYDREANTTAMLWADTTLAGVYEITVGVNDSTDPDWRAQAAVLTVWIRGALASLYDPTDPAEAAEQVVFALGGRGCVPPRAAQ